MSELSHGNGHPAGESGGAGTPRARWETVCRLEQLQPDRGVAALIGRTQVALFRIIEPVAAESAVGSLYAIGNHDPCSGAWVLSRGIVGDREGEPVVASPIYKQSFSLVTGQCLDEPDTSVPVYRVRVEDGWVQVGLA